MDMIEEVKSILGGKLPWGILQQAPFMRRTDSIKYESQNAISAFRCLDGRDESSSSDDEGKNKAPAKGNTSSTDGNNGKTDVKVPTSHHKFIHSKYLVTEET
ncbi:hypothetical protein CSIM01_12981 [Colletotrichum simmondsii]|uniref:Uncharacterized protein n=1 Tax=Colletotrichum simmondsii TaxID=703756 RepID=A0A135RRG7_9PEZI|nr:hypothetical protein CSIM01_12981 [Colletotrichum simmondsii]